MTSKYSVWIQAKAEVTDLPETTQSKAWLIYEAFDLGYKVSRTIGSGLFKASKHTAGRINAGVRAIPGVAGE